jgi:CPA2 family monovalent cation:H+ antiporter-2
MAEAQAWAALKAAVLLGLLFYGGQKLMRWWTTGGWSSC